MRNCVIIIALSVVMLASCQKTMQMSIEVSNPSDVVHENSTVEVAWTALVAKMRDADPSKLIVTDADDVEYVHQIIYYGAQTPQALIFQITLAPRETAKFFISEGKPQHEAVSKTFGRFVPERKDDFAWENDRVVFRMYGPALADEYPSNGVDLWLKKTEKLIVDQFYNDDLNNAKSYHVDHGEGLDCYKVGHALGCGGIAPFVNDTLWVGNHYVTQEVWDNGPLRTTFRLTYDNLPVGKQIYSQEIIISLDAGSQLNKAVVAFDGDFNEIEIAAGIFLHDDPGNIKNDVAAGFNAFGETATSDAGEPAGRNYVATIIPDGKMRESREQQEHWLAIAPYVKGEKFTYYFGGGWNQWGFETDDEWFNYVAQFAEKLKNPLTVNVISD